MNLGPKLVDVCPVYAQALDEFERLTDAGDYESAELKWQEIVKIAREFRRPKVVAPA